VALLVIVTLSRNTGLVDVVDFLENPKRFDGGIGAVQRWTSSKFINLTLERVMG